MSTIITKNAAFRLFLCVFLIFFACKKQKDIPASVFFDKGISSAKKKNYESCVYNLGKIDEISPYSSHAKTAQPVLIYCHYMQKNYEQVHSMIENFESIYPTSDQLSYLHYISALSYFRVIKSHRKSMQTVQNLALKIQKVNEIDSYSVYAENLNKLLPFIAKIQDENTLYIAQNYAKTNDFISAAARYSTLQEKTLHEETEKIVENSMNDILMNLGIKE